MSMQLEVEVLGRFAEYAVGTGVLVLSLLHVVRVIVRLTRWLVTEIREQWQLLLADVRQLRSELPRSTPTDTTTPSAATPAAARRSAS